MRLFKYFLITVSICILFTSKLYAAEGITVSPPPIPWFDYTEEQIDLKVGLSFGSVTGDDINVMGGSVGIFGRYAVSNVYALDLGFSYIGGGGSYGSDLDNDVELHNWTINADLEIKPKIPTKMIVFIGIVVPLTDVTFWPNSYANNSFIVMYGPQAGIQASFEVGGFVFTPYFRFQYLMGSYETWVYSSGPTRYYADDMEAFIQPTIGIDIVHIGTGLVLSGLMQFSQNESEYNSILITLSYNFNWEGKKEENKENN